MRMRQSTILVIFPLNLHENPAALWKSSFQAKLREIQDRSNKNSV